MGAWVYPTAGDNVLDRDVVKLSFFASFEFGLVFVARVRKPLDPALVTQLLGEVNEKERANSSAGVKNAREVTENSQTKSKSKRKREAKQRRRQRPQVRVCTDR